MMSALGALAHFPRIRYIRALLHTEREFDVSTGCADAKRNILLYITVYREEIQFGAVWKTCVTNMCCGGPSRAHCQGHRGG